MLIRVADLHLRKLEFKQSFEPGAIEFGLDFRQLGPLDTEGQAQVIVEHRGHKENIDDIRVVAKLDVTMETRDQAHAEEIFRALEAEALHPVWIDTASTME